MDAEVRDLAWLGRQGLVPVEVAAAVLGIEPKRLRGFIARNSIADPVGDMKEVYGDTCTTLAKRLGDMTSGDRVSGGRE